MNVAFSGPPGGQAAHGASDGRAARVRCDDNPGTVAPEVGDGQDPPSGDPDGDDEDDGYVPL